MRRIELSAICIVALWIIIILLPLAMNGKASAQDTQVSSCYTRTDAGAVFIFSNIPDSWFGDVGWYFIGDDVKVNDHTLVVTGLQFDNGYSYAIVGTNDHSETDTAATDLTPECSKPTVPIVTPIPQPQPSIKPIESTGRTCTVKYPEIIVVCK